MYIKLLFLLFALISLLSMFTIEPSTTFSIPPLNINIFLFTVLFIIVFCPYIETVPLISNIVSKATSLIFILSTTTSLVVATLNKIPLFTFLSTILTFDNTNLLLYVLLLSLYISEPFILIGNSLLLPYTSMFVVAKTFVSVDSILFTVLLQFVNTNFLSLLSNALLVVMLYPLRHTFKLSFIVISFVRFTSCII